MASIHFGQRKIAARMHVEQAVVGLDIREELDAGAVFAVGDEDAASSATVSTSTVIGKRTACLTIAMYQPSRLSSS